MFKDMSYHCFFDGTLLYVGMYFTGYNIKALILLDLLPPCSSQSTSPPPFNSGTSSWLPPHHQLLVALTELLWRVGLNPSGHPLGKSNFRSLTFSTPSVIAGFSWGPTSWLMPSQPKRMRTETFLDWVLSPIPLPPSQVCCRTSTSPYSHGEKGDVCICFGASGWKRRYCLLQSLVGWPQGQQCPKGEEASCMEAELCC